MVQSSQLAAVYNIRSVAGWFPAHRERRHVLFREEAPQAEKRAAETQTHARREPSAGA